MKTSIYIALIVLVTIGGSCVHKRHAEQLTKEKQQLTLTLNERDSTINELNGIISKIHSDLELLSEQKKELTLIDVKEQYGEKEKQLIQSINTLMQSNKQKIESLQGKLSNVHYSNQKVVELNKSLDELKEKLAKNEKDINQLNQKISGLNGNIVVKSLKVDSLNAMILAKDKKISELNQKLYAAYYIIDDEKTLKDKNIVVKKGGFLGLFGRVEKLKSGLNKNYFTKIDKGETTTITFPQEFENVELISTHKSESYTLEGNKLEILNPEVFWESSKYLVIQEG